MKRALRHGGFTLIELLLAVFILAIGIISVSALFPAGILQQQRAQDDQFGPVVAEAALGVLRNRVDASDFGTFEEHDQLTVLQGSTFRQSYIFRPTVGDWSWARPSLYRVTSGVSVPGSQPDGAIDIFGAGLLQSGYPGQTGNYVHELATPMGAVRGIPFNRTRSPTPTQAPSIVVTQRERCWPMVPEGQAGDGVVPEYMWDCMFRRTGGRIQVAIFVYRVVAQGSSRRMYVSPVQFPVRRCVAGTGTNGSTQQGAASAPMVAAAWTPGANPAFPGPFTSGTIGAAQGLLPTDIQSNAIPPLFHQWQLPGQWIVDNNANVHRVVRGRLLGGTSESAEVRLSSPIPVPPVSESAGDYELESPPQLQQLVTGIRTFFFIPGIPDDGSTQLVPVYATVRDL